MATRRQVLQVSGALLVCWLTEPTAFAQEDYPGSREVHVIAAYPPGSEADIIPRYFSENMRPFLGATIVVENKVGASGNIAITYVAKAKPDGYTILITPPTAIAAGLSLFKNPGSDPSAFAVLGSACRYAFTVSVAANSPHKTLQSLIDAVRAKGANASYATTANPAQLAGGMMNRRFAGPFHHSQEPGRGDWRPSLGNEHTRARTLRRPQCSKLWPMQWMHTLGAALGPIRHPIRPFGLSFGHVR